MNVNNGYIENKNGGENIQRQSGIKRNGAYY